MAKKQAVKKSSGDKGGSPKKAKRGAKKKKGTKKTKGLKNSLVANINRRKKSGKSRSKKNSTISKKAYSDMQKGWSE